MLSFWPLVIVVIANGAKAMRGRKISPAVYQQLMAMLPVAEAQLHFALQRQACRGFGWSVRAIRRDQTAPLSDWNDFIPRFEAYRLAIIDLDRASRAFTQSLRRGYRICPRVDATAVAGGPARVVHLRDAPTATTPHHCNSRGVLILRRPKAVSRDEGGLTNARGPPAYCLFPTPWSLRKRPLPSPRPRACYAPPRCSSLTALMYDQSMCAATPR
ncbi:MAG: hypothetical protein RIR33_1211 [Pseudomonadota bacterium]|jgi:hypothetical protein